MERKQYIDRLKGLAILFVVICHLYGTLDNLGANHGILFMNRVQMPLFMFLSGLVTPPTSITSKKLISKSKRFLVPFFVIGIFFSYFEGSSVISFLQADFKLGYWYLLTLAEFYLILFVIRPLIRKFKKLWHILAIAFLIEMLLRFITHEINMACSGIDVFSLERMSEMWPYFIIGAIVRQYDCMNLIFKNSSILAISIILVILGSTDWCLENRTRFFVAYPFALACIIVFVYYFSIRESYSNKIENGLALFGRHSLDIYIFHYFIIQSINLKFIFNWTVSTCNGLLEIFAFFSIAVLVAFICVGIGWCIRQNKFTNSFVFGNSMCPIT